MASQSNNDNKHIMGQTIHTNKEKLFPKRNEKLENHQNVFDKLNERTTLIRYLSICII